jgi:hypothetical protein
MKHGMGLLLGLALIAGLGGACGPAQPNNQDGSTGPCDPTNCLATCQVQGYPGGNCVGDACHCTGQDPDGGLLGTTITGKVWSPGQLVGISSALVHFSASEPPAIPDGAYPETCNVPNGAHVLTNPDGTFTIGVAPGTYYLVIQKGQFRRVREYIVPETGPVQLDTQLTTLPSNMNAPGDTIPNMAMVWAMSNGDKIEKALATLGMAQVDTWGDLQMGTEEFDVYNVSPYEPNTALLNNLSRMLEYHILFFPCTIAGGGQLNDPTGPLAEPAVLENIRAYLAAGGKIYSTDMMYDIFEQALPEYLDMCGDDGIINDADTEAWAHTETSSGWTSHGRAVDTNLAAWLDSVGFNSQDIDLEENFVWIDDMYTEYEPIAGDPEPPHIWVEGDFILNPSQIMPLTVTFPYGPGKVLFSTYHTVGNSSQQQIQGLIAQEWILVYLIMEIGVCSTPVL